MYQRLALQAHLAHDECCYAKLKADLSLVFDLIAYRLLTRVAVFGAWLTHIVSIVQDLHQPILDVSGSSCTCIAC